MVSGADRPVIAIRGKYPICHAIATAAMINPAMTKMRLLNRRKKPPGGPTLHHLRASFTPANPGSAGAPGRKKGGLNWPAPADSLTRDQLIRN